MMDTLLTAATFFLLGITFDRFILRVLVDLESDAMRRRGKRG